MVDRKLPELKVIDGAVVTDIEQRVAENKALLLGDDVTRIQILTAKLMRVMGKSVKTRVVLPALATCVAKVFTVIPHDKHAQSLLAFMNLVATAIRAEYTPEQQEQLRLQQLAIQKAQFQAVAPDTPAPEMRDAETSKPE